MQGATTPGECQAPAALAVGATLAAAGLRPEQITQILAEGLFERPQQQLSPEAPLGAAPAGAALLVDGTDVALELRQIPSAARIGAFRGTLLVPPAV